MASMSNCYINDCGPHKMTITVTMTRRFRVRMWMALFLIKLGARCFPGVCNVKTETTDHGNS